MAVERGDVIIVSKPFAHVILTRARGTRCETCLSKKDNLKRCMKCSFAFYCDRTCQKNAWLDHKLECSSLVKVQPRVPPDFILLLARIIRKLKREGDCEEKVGNVCRRFSDLMPHLTEIKKDVKRNGIMDSSYFVLSQYLEVDELPTREEVLEMFGKIFINAITILDEQESIASGLYIGPSIFNHSCEPNATVIFNGPQLLIRSLANFSTLDISKIYINYIDLLATTEARQQQLQEQFYFLCECPTCLDVARDDLMHAIKCDNPQCSHAIIPDKVLKCSACSTLVKGERVQHGKTIMKSLEDIIQNNQPSEKRWKDIKDMLEDAKKVLHPLNLFLIKGLDEAFEMCIQMNDFETALKYGIDTLPGFRKYLNDAQVAFGLQLAKIGKIQLLLNHLEDAKHSLFEANEHLRFRYGNKHPVFERFKDTMLRLEVALKHQNK